MIPSALTLSGAAEITIEQAFLPSGRPSEQQQSINSSTIRQGLARALCWT
ncbi:hypothetical protein [Humitalea rosea]|nr:hypothetical protein [Humitalea rosea]